MKHAAERRGILLADLQQEEPTAPCSQRVWFTATWFSSILRESQQILARFEPVTSGVVVLHRNGASPHVAAARVGNVLYTDQLPYSPLGTRRVFWLLDHDIQMVYEPFGWTNEWYVDVVQIEIVQTAQGVIHHVRDMEVDIVVEGMGPTYRVIDLERFGQRALAGEFTVADVAEVLHKMQAFLDAFLHRGAPWPPPPIRGLFSPTHAYPSPAQPAPALVDVLLLAHPGTGSRP